MNNVINLLTLFRKKPCLFYTIYSNSADKIITEKNNDGNETESNFAMNGFKANYIESIF